MKKYIYGLCILCISMLPLQSFALTPGQNSDQGMIQADTPATNGEYDIYVGESTGGNWSAVKVDHRTGQAWWQGANGWTPITDAQPVPPSYYVYRFIFYKLGNSGTWSIWRLDPKTGQVWDNTQTGTAWQMVPTAPATPPTTTPNTTNTTPTNTNTTSTPTSK